MTSLFPATLPGLLDQAAERFPGHGVSFVYPHHTTPLVTFPELKQQALALLDGLQQKGLEKNHRVILSLEKSEEIIPVLWACFYGGMIPALLQPPLSFSEYNPAAEKAARVFAILDNPFVIMSHLHAREWHESGIPHDRLVDFNQIHGNPAKAIIATGNPGDLAMIQFSSGSTGDPKGVMLTHENIIVNTADIIRGIRLESEDVSVNWMPLYHDMGLIGFHFTPVFAGVNQYFINPVDFVKNPSLWLDQMSKVRCTITACPNFGQVIVNRYLARRKPLDIDLSPLRILFNGAEPISVSTMKAFLEALGSYGLNPEAMFPAYGLAEATLAVTFPEPEEPAGVTCFGRDQLLSEKRAAETSPEDPGAMALVSLGKVLRHVEMKIVDHQYEPLPDGHVGQILIRGRNVTSGYYSNESASAGLFFREWLQTGDLGFIYRGSLYVTGRYKDIIFINGINFFAHDLENIALDVPGISYGKIVMAGCFDEKEGRDRLLVFIVGACNDDTKQLCLALKNHFANKAGLIPDLFIPVRSADIPRTSSGKLQRYKMVERYLRAEFPDTIVL